jgi:DNA polymerase IV
MAESTAPDASTDVLHVDMDAFFAAVELRERPDLVGLPVAVGGGGPRGVISTASYAARRFGVHSALSTAVARRRCPDLVLLEPRHSLYRAVSAQVMGVLDEVTPRVERISVDEAFLDVRGARRLLGTPLDVGRLIKRRIREETGLVCSVGIAVNRSVAKIASDRSKPDGLLLVPAGSTRDFLDPLPVGALSGIGAVAQKSLAQRLGIVTVGDLARVPLPTLRTVLGSGADRMRLVALGLEREPVVPRAPEKSIGHEHTYDEDIADPARVRAELAELADRLGSDLRSHDLAAATVVLKLKWSDGTIVTRSSTAPHPTQSGQRLRETVDALWGRIEPTMRPVRLLGVRGESLVPAAGGTGQRELSARAGWDELERALDSARDRFGDASVLRASRVRRDGGAGGEAGNSRGDERPG